MQLLRFTIARFYEAFSRCFLFWKPVNKREFSTIRKLNTQFLKKCSLEKQNQDVKSQENESQKYCDQHCPTENIGLDQRIRRLNETT